jgi:uncharacterized protein
MSKQILLVLVIALSAGTAFAQDNVDRPLITVSGQAEVRVAPDEVVFTLEVESVDKDITLAKKKTDDSVREVLAIARRNGVKEADVQTSYISVEPKYNTDDIEYGERPRVKREFVGYRVSKTVAVILRDIPKFDGLLSDVLKAGVTRVRNVEFRNSQIRKHRDQARAMAMKAAKEKATAMAAEIGQTIGRAYSITEGGGVNPYARTMNQNVSTSVGASLSEEDSAIAPGMISVTAQVLVSFRLQ